MTNVAALPAVALLVGAAAGVYAPVPLAAFVMCAAIGWLTLTSVLLAPFVMARFRRLLQPMASCGRDTACGGVADDGGERMRSAAPLVMSAVMPPDMAPVDGAWLGALAIGASLAGFFGVGATLAAEATREALRPPILADSHAMRADVVGAGGAVPVVLSGLILADASATEFGAMFTLAANAIRVDGVDGVDRETAGTIRIAVGGTSAARHIGDWRAGRRVRLTATLAAPLPYLNIGTTNQETRLALAGIRLFGSVKSATHVELLAHGRWWDEAAASARSFVRRALDTHVAPRDRLSAAIVTAILIGDRAGLDQDVEERLQRAGTFHVIAISGGNIAILTALILALLRLAGTPPRASAWMTISAIALYALVVGSGASVARAALAAIVYLFARAIDHRTPPVNVLAVVVAMILVWAPLEIVDAGFWLTCLATLAIMLLAQRLADRARAVLALRRAAAEPPEGSQAPGQVHEHRGGWFVNRLAEPAIGLLAATVAAEAVLLPVTAYAFSQVSIAGLLLNFLAIPLMTVVQLAGIAIVISAHGLAPIADIAGVIADSAARGIVSSSRFVDAAPWSAPRVAPPPLWLLLVCQASLCAAWFGRPPPWRRRVAACAWLTCLGLVVWALPLPSFALHANGSEECQMNDADSESDSESDSASNADTDAADASADAGAGIDANVAAAAARSRLGSGDAARRRLRVTFLDVAQGDATLIRFPDGRAWLVDAGGALGRFDIGTRIVSPALWGLGLRRLSTLVLTHGDRDHIGGAHAMLRDFRPGEVWEGVPVDGHADLTRLRAEAARRHMRWRVVQTSARATRVVADDGGDVDIRVWHPSAPEWIRTRVRNDDSIVLELAFGNVSVILPGDIGSAVERVLASQHASAAPLRVLKVPHHGSKTSSTAAFLDALHPRLAIVSAGRGNRHGHPAPAALARYAARGTEVFRTDRDGAIQLDTDGQTLIVRTCSGRRLSLAADGLGAGSRLARSHD
jgi:competence protein ComEC